MQSTMADRCYESQLAANRRYRKNHPDKAMMYRLNAAVALLIRHGYSISAPANTAVKGGAANG